MSIERLNHLASRLTKLAAEPEKLLDSIGELAAVLGDLTNMSMVALNLPDARKQSVFANPDLAVQIAAVLALRLGGSVDVTQADLEGLARHSAEESYNGQTDVFNLTVALKV